MFRLKLSQILIASVPWLVAVAGVLLFRHVALAQSAADVVNAACSDAVRPYLVWALGVIGVTSAITWAKSLMKALPQPVQHVINFLALNWRQIAVDAGKAAPAALLLAIILAGCANGQKDQLLTFQPTGNLAADLATVNSDVQADVATFNTQAAAFNAGAVKDAIIVGNAACPLLAEAHTAYISALGQAAVQVGATAAGAPVAAAAADATEAVVYADVQKDCAIVAAASQAEQTSPTAAEILAVQQIVADVPKLQQAIATVSPAAASLLAVPPAAAATTATPAAGVAAPVPAPSAATP